MAWAPPRVNSNSSFQVDLAKVDASTLQNLTKSSFAALSSPQSLSTSQRIRKTVPLYVGKGTEVKLAVALEGRKMKPQPAPPQANPNSQKFVPNVVVQKTQQALQQEKEKREREKREKREKEFRERKTEREQVKEEKQRKAASVAPVSLRKASPLILSTNLTLKEKEKLLEVGVKSFFEKADMAKNSLREMTVQPGANKPSNWGSTLQSMLPHSKTRTEVLSYADLISDSTCFLAVLTPGNNHKLIERVFAETRPWWRVTQTDFGGNVFHLKWKQHTSGGRGAAASSMWQNMLEGQQMVNHYRYSGELCTKGELLRNMSNYCNRLGLDVWEYLPLSCVLRGGLEGPDFKFVQLLINKVHSTKGGDFLSFQHGEVTGNNSAMFLTSQSTSNFSLSKRPISAARTSTSFLGRASLTGTSLKIKLKHSLKLDGGKEKERDDTIKGKEKERAEKKTSFDAAEAHATSRALPGGAKLRRKSVGRNVRTMQKEVDTLSSEKPGLWLLKPGALSRGRGIEVFRTVEDLAFCIANTTYQNSQGYARAASLLSLGALAPSKPVQQKLTVRCALSLGRKEIPLPPKKLPPPTELEIKPLEQLQKSNSPGMASTTDGSESNSGARGMHRLQSASSARSGTSKSIEDMSDPCDQMPDAEGTENKKLLRQESPQVAEGKSPTPKLPKRSLQQPESLKQILAISPRSFAVASRDEKIKQIQKIKEMLVQKDDGRPLRERLQEKVVSLLAQRKTAKKSTEKHAEDSKLKQQRLGGDQEAENSFSGALDLAVETLKKSSVQKDKKALPAELEEDNLESASDLIGRMESLEVRSVPRADVSGEVVEPSQDSDVDFEDSMGSVSINEEKAQKKTDKNESVLSKAETAPLKTQQGPVKAKVEATTGTTKGEVRKRLGMSKDKTPPVVKEWVVQKYIEKPLLLGGRKFDIRMWCVVTPWMHVYCYREGYVRTASVPLKIEKDNEFDPYMHLCNNAIQKKGSGYGTLEAGNQISFDDLQRILDGQVGPAHRASGVSGHHTCYAGKSVRGDLLPAMYDAIALSLHATSRQIRGGEPLGVCFQLLGYDFMVDEDMGVWLIEVNSNPCLEESSPLLKRLLPDMISGCLSLSVDPLFKPRRPRVKTESGETHGQTHHRLLNTAAKGFDFICCLNTPLSGLNRVLAKRDGRNVKAAGRVCSCEVDPALKVQAASAKNHR